ncbi:MAG: hypothetical protein Ct9H90mP27_6780 [Gammaproteobacteria bacterium]|nr:MAG: hypothetical protein Ct9H90mP27_6780 [Gammaproteobacteria bacterium]
MLWRRPSLARWSSLVFRHARPKDHSSYAGRKLRNIVKLKDAQTLGLGWLPDGKLLIVSMSKRQLFSGTALSYQFTPI